MAKHRSDIAAALDQVKAVKANSYRSLKFLPEQIPENEGVLRIAITKVDGGEGLLALTPHRLVFFRQKAFSATHDDFQLNQITAVDWKGKLAKGTLTVTVAGVRREFPKIFATDGEAMAAALRSQIAEGNAPPVAPASGGVDIASTLAHLGDLHSAGLLTDEEFAAAKARALAD